MPPACGGRYRSLTSAWSAAPLTETRARAHTNTACSLTLSCTGLEADSVWQQIPSDFCSFWNHFSALFSAGRPWCLQIVPLSLPLGMFIKFLQSSLYFSATPPPLFRARCLSLAPLELELGAKNRSSPCCFCFVFLLWREYSSIRGAVYILLLLSGAFAHSLPKRHLSVYWLRRRRIIWAARKLLSP